MFNTLTQKYDIDVTVYEASEIWSKELNKATKIREEKIADEIKNYGESVTNRSIIIGIDEELSSEGAPLGYCLIPKFSYKTQIRLEKFYIND